MVAFRSILIGFAAMTVLSVTTFAQRVSYDCQRWEDFSNLKTFSFKKTAPIDKGAAQTTLYDDPFTRERTEAAIAGQLQAHGMRRDDAQPDVYVTAKRTFQTEYRIYGPYGWWGWADGMGYQYTNYGGPWSGDQTIVGTLTVDVSNPRGELLWRAISEAPVHPHARPGERAEHINREVVKLFKRFPSTGPGGYFPRPRNRVAP
jgi:Domain of unknown function (DUF4136)